MPVMNKLTIYLTPDEHAALTLMADRERRKPAEQAAWEVGRRALQWKALDDLDKAPPSTLTLEDCGLAPDGPLTLELDAGVLAALNSRYKDGPVD